MTTWRHGVFEAAVYPDCAWVRVFGYGVSVKLFGRRMFSERYGHSRVLRLGPLSIKALRPMRMRMRGDS